MFALWPGDQLNFSIFIKPTFGFAGQRAASQRHHCRNTNVGASFLNQMSGFQPIIHPTQQSNPVPEICQLLLNVTCLRYL